MAAYYRPSEQASGDYYDVVPLINGWWGFIMADVSGHGTPAAVIMAVLRTLIHAELPTNRSKTSGEFLERVNDVMSQTYLTGGRFVTVWAAVFDPDARTLTYASAGHNPPRLLRCGQVHELAGSGGLPLGVDSKSTYEEKRITLEPDDLLVIYTDGVTETAQPGQEGRAMFGTHHLDRVIQNCSEHGAADSAQRIVEALAEFTADAPPTDDQTMPILRVRGTPSNPRD